MLTDIFAIRYQQRPIWKEFGEPERTLLFQCYRMISEQLMPYWGPDSKPIVVNASLWSSVERKLSLELGRESLSQKYWTSTTPQGTVYKEYTPDRIVKNWMFASHDGCDIDRFIKERISFIELVFREREGYVREENKKFVDYQQRQQALKAPGGAGGVQALSDMLMLTMQMPLAQNASSLRESIDELNARFKLHKMPLQYHNGFVQITGDCLTDAQIETPFWELLTDVRFANVSRDMAEAVDRRDTGGRDPAFYAAKALESAIKVVCIELDLSTGNERNASQYIDRLMAKRNGRFIEVWEGDALKHFFGEVRNPLGHGPGGDEMPELNPAQTDWAIETAMSWTKSLVRRLISSGASRAVVA